MPRTLALAPLLLLATALDASPGNRLCYLDGASPFHVGAHFPKLTTPMWIGEEGVESAIILSIDDLREGRVEHYRDYLEPILKRLEEVQGKGKASLSIFTNTVKTDEPQLARWFERGARLDVHTRSHPCPLLKGPLDGAVAQVLDCLENLEKTGGPGPVCFRMPCCDSINSASPRFFSEIATRRTGDGAFLRADSSVMMFPEESYAAYAPFPNYAGTATGYPYPFVVGKLLWEFPIIAPTDWQAQHRRGVQHADTVADIQAGIDRVFEARGLYTFCFHPHGWIRNDQVVEIVDHAVAKYGRRVRFLEFHEALERIERNLLGGVPLRGEEGEDSGVRLLDVDNDGFLDVVIGNDERRVCRLWDPESSSWKEIEFPFRLVTRAEDGEIHSTGLRFGVHDERGHASALVIGMEEVGFATFDGARWQRQDLPIAELLASGRPVVSSWRGRDRGVRLRDVDGDGLSDLIVNNESQNAVLCWKPGEGSFVAGSLALPRPGSVVDARGRDRGLRFVDADGDGRDDVILSNDDEYYLYLYRDAERGWGRRVLHGPAGSSGALPRFVSRGQDRGAWFKDGVLYVANEDTASRDDLVEVVPLAELLEHKSSLPTEPEEAVKLFDLPEGFTIELVASEPLVADPVSIHFAPDGRIWVVEMGGYPRGEGTDADGRVRELTDTDGDGRIDRSTLFKSGLSFPTAALALDRGLLVSCAPDILYLEDRDGDGRCDVERTIFTGFGEGNQQHRVNGLQFGIDNWIYGANGDSAGTIHNRARPDRPGVSIRGRDFRFTRELGRFEAVSGRTQYGLTADDFGDRFGASNSRHILHAVLPEREMGRNPHVAAPDPVLDIPDHGAMARIFPISTMLLSLNDIHVPGHFSSACGIAVYRGDAFPPAYRGNTFVCEPVGNLVHRDVLEAKGATFIARRGEMRSDFLRSTDNWFRPVFATTGPDGCLWVVDMYRYVIEHPQYIPRHLHRILDFGAGRNRGRIYRVSHREGAAVLSTRKLHNDLSRASNAELVEQLLHPVGWWRDSAQRLLVDRKDRIGQDELGRLRELAREAGSPASRVHALWTLRGLEQLPAEDVLAATRDAHERVREHALRLAGPYVNSNAAVSKRVVDMATDASFRVRLHAAFRLGEIAGEPAGRALASILRRDIADRWMRAAVLASSVEHAGTLLGLLLSEPARPAGREAAEREVLDALLRVLVRSGETDSIVSFLSSVQKTATIRREHIVSWHAIASASREVLRTLGRQDPAVRRLALRIREAASEIARDPELSLDRRIEAVEVLGLAGEAPVFRQLLSAKEPVELQLAAIRALAREAENHEDAEALCLDAWPGAGPAARGEILQALLSTTRGAATLLTAIEAGRIAEGELDATSRERLLKHDDEGIGVRAAASLRPHPAADRSAVVERYLGEIAGRPGMAQKGREVFSRLCSPCHRLDGLGHEIGPDLTASGTKERHVLVEAILNPGNFVPPRYANYVVTTVSGQVATGIIASETANAVTLLRANGVRESVLRSDILKLQSSTTSLMPTNLEKDLSAADLADLLAFLADRPAEKPK